jgi:hypothetical protein
MQNHMSVEEDYHLPAEEDQGGALAEGALPLPATCLTRLVVAVCRPPSSTRTQLDVAAMYVELKEEWSFDEEDCPLTVEEDQGGAPAEAGLPLPGTNLTLSEQRWMKKVAE